MKEFLHENGLAFVEKDITTDDAAFTTLTAMGFAVTPVIVIDSETVVGCNRAKLERLLNL